MLVLCAYGAFGRWSPAGLRLQSEYVCLATTFYLYIVLSGKALFETKRSPVAVACSMAHALYTVLNKRGHDTLSQLWTNYVHLGMCSLTLKTIQSKDRVVMAQKAGCMLVCGSCTGTRHKAQGTRHKHCHWRSDVTTAGANCLDDLDSHHQIIMISLGNEVCLVNADQHRCLQALFLFNATSTSPCLQSCCATILPGYWSAWKGQVVLRIKTPWVAWWAKLTMFHKE